MQIDIKPVRVAAALRMVALLVGLIVPAVAAAQAPPMQTFSPPTGKGRGVLVISGQSGSANYTPVAKQIAALGYNVVLVDGNDIFKRDNAGLPALNATFAALQGNPATIPGKVGVVGFSLGGGAALTYATRMSDKVATVVAYYPYTAFIQDPADFAGKMKVPTLVLAATKDTYKNCCMIDMARRLAQAAKSASPPTLTLVEYPSADHAFILPGPKQRAADAADALKRTQAHLRAALGD